MQDAQARNPSTAFDVLTPIPTKAPAAEQEKYIQQGGEDARIVGRDLQANGIDADHVHLGFRGDDGTPPREVRVYAH